MTTRVDADALTRIYAKWLTHCYPNSAADRLKWMYDFNRLNLSYGDGKDFDMFVWGSGGHIRRENGKRFIHFFDDSDATMFLLRWS